MNELADLVHRENGKPHGDAILEITLAIDHLAWAGAHARKTLGPRRVRAGMLAANHAAYLEYQPLGVVGVIGPWNYPVFTPMGSIAYALAAGNAVVFKPSEYTPAIGAWLAAAWRAAVPDAADAFQVVTGYGETGAALCRAGVGKLAFTGSAPTGRKVMAACAETLTPVLMELGGKDAMIVDDDADVVAAADAAVWGAMSNAGPDLHRHRAGLRHQRRLRPVRRRGHRAGAHAAPGFGRRGHLRPDDDGLAGRHRPAARRGRRRRRAAGSSAATPTRACSPTRTTSLPTVLLDVPEDVVGHPRGDLRPDADRSPRCATPRRRSTLTNATSYGLAGSVFSKSKARGLDLARRMRSGMTSINSVLTFASVPALPFGGVGDSGFGRIHGEDGLKEFTRAKAITRQRVALPVNLMSFSRPASATDALARVMGMIHGRHR